MTAPALGGARRAAWVALTVGLAAAAAAEPRVAAVPALLAIAVAAWRWPDTTLHLAAIALLAVRPSLDIFSERRVGLGPFAMSPAVALGALILWVTLTLGLRRASAGLPIWADRRLWRTHVWLFLVYGIGAYSGWHWHGSVGLAQGARELIRAASIVAGFLVVLWWVEVDSRACVRGWAYLLAGTIVPIAVALGQLGSQRGFLDEGVIRIQGTFSHPNNFGSYLIPFILVAVVGGVASAALSRVVRFAFAIGLSVLVALTYSRTAILALVVALILVPIVESRRLGWKGLARGLVVVALVGALGWWLEGDLLRQRFAGITLSLFSWEQAQQGISENSLTWRLINWFFLVRLGLEHPVIGHGGGMATVLNTMIDIRSGLPFSPHDDFVKFFVETGVVGLACYVIYGILLCAWTLRRAREGGQSIAPVAYALAASLLSLFFLTAGVPELAVNTAILHTLYGMLALVSVNEPGLRRLTLSPSPAEPRGTVTPGADSVASLPHPGEATTL